MSAAAGPTELGEQVRLGASTVRVAGHLELVPTDGGVRPVRVPTAAWSHLPPGSELVRAVMSQASGVRVTARTAATRLSLRVRCVRIDVGDWQGRTGEFVVAVDGDEVATLAAPVDEVRSVELFGDRVSRSVHSTATTLYVGGLPAGDKEVTIWFPPAMVVDVLGLEGDAPVRPPAPVDRPVWLHHGSSISHGQEAGGPTATWPVVAARHAGLEVVNLGLAGQCMLDPFVADAIAATPADVITLKLGINVVGARAMDQRTFVPAVHGFLDRIRAGHPTTPIVVASAICWPGNEDRPGPTGVELVGGAPVRCFAVGDPADAAGGALTLETSREHLRHVVAVRAGSGEPVRYLDGLELYGPADAESMPLLDGIHPGPDAHAEIGRRFAALVFGAGGLVPATEL